MKVEAQPDLPTDIVESLRFLELMIMRKCNHTCIQMSSVSFDNATLDYILGFWVCTVR